MISALSVGPHRSVGIESPGVLMGDSRCGSWRHTRGPGKNVSVGAKANRGGGRDVRAESPFSIWVAGLKLRVDDLG